MDEVEDVVMTSIIPGDLPNHNIPPKGQSTFHDWKSNLVKMFKRWRSADYVAETTKIVRMKLDRWQGSKDAEIIVPDKELNKMPIDYLGR